MLDVNQVKYDLTADVGIFLALVVAQRGSKDKSGKSICFVSHSSTVKHTPKSRSTNLGKIPKAETWDTRHAYWGAHTVHGIKAFFHPMQATPEHRRCVPGCHSRLVIQLSMSLFHALSRLFDSIMLLVQNQNNSNTTTPTHYQHAALVRLSLHRLSPCNVQNINRRCNSNNLKTTTTTTTTINKLVQA